MDRLEAVLQKLDSYQMEVDVTGDINCIVDAITPDCCTQKLPIRETYQHSQLINQPTRITHHTSSTIDLFLTNKPLYSESGMICIPSSNAQILSERFS